MLVWHSHPLFGGLDLYTTVVQHGKAVFAKFTIKGIKFDDVHK